MRFVAIKSKEQQASAAVFRARDLFVRQRTLFINALRGRDLEDGRSNIEAPHHHRQQRSGFPSGKEPCPARIMARADGGEEAAPARDRRARQQGRASSGRVLAKDEDYGTPATAA